SSTHDPQNEDIKGGEQSAIGGANAPKKISKHNQLHQGYRSHKGKRNAGDGHGAQPLQVVFDQVHIDGIAQSSRHYEQRIKIELRHRATRSGGDQNGCADEPHKNTNEYPRRLPLLVNEQAYKNSENGS